MSCACIKKREFDISVSNRGCDVLVFEDQSNWVADAGFNKPDTYKVVIEIPSRGMSKELDIKTSGKNFITSVDLYGTIDRENLADEIYCISTVSCGYDLKINRASLANLELKVNELIAKYALHMEDAQSRLLMDFILQLESIKINAEQGNHNLAIKLFSKLKKTLKNYHCDNC